MTSKLAAMSTEALTSVSGGAMYPRGRQLVKIAKFLQTGEATGWMSRPMLNDLGGTLRSTVHSHPFWQWGGIQSKARAWLGNESIGQVIQQGLHAAE